MSPEELDKAKWAEAYTRAQRADREGDPLQWEQAAVLIYRQMTIDNWTPPAPISPRLRAAREWLKTAMPLIHGVIDSGSIDHGPTCRAFLAGVDGLSRRPSRWWRYSLTHEIALATEPSPPTAKRSENPMKVSEAIARIEVGLNSPYTVLPSKADLRAIIRSHEALRLAAGKVLELGLHHAEKELSRAHQEASQ